MLGMAASDRTDAPFEGGPVAALRRIAFLLERSRAETYKVKAFRAAADVLLPLDPDEVGARARSGTLRELPGIGASTAEVIEAAVEGRTPARLAKLEDEVGGPLVEGGESIRAALKGDLHSHSDWSDGGSPIEEMAFTAIELGHEYLVLTDHSPRLKVANGLSISRLNKQLEVVEAINAHLGGNFALLKGIEVDILDDGSLDQTDEMLAKLDVRVASVHSKLAMDKHAMTRRMIAAVQNPFTNVLGHCTGRLVTGNRGTRAQSEFDAEKVFAACAEHGVAVEINSRPERRDPPTNLLTMAIEMGCLFSIDTDAHAPGQLEFLSYGCERAEDLGLEPERVINTWPVDRLLAWCNKS
jgi:putative hydrolase